LLAEVDVTLEDLKKVYGYLDGGTRLLSPAPHGSLLSL
jgi:hypothetical protein